MNLFHITNRAQNKSMNFIKRLLNSGNFYLSNQSFQIGWVIKGDTSWLDTKFQHNISKITPAIGLRHWDTGCVYQ